MRSKLFVPASRPELFDKAAGSAADFVSFDLEDSVAPAHKASARVLLAQWLNRASSARTQDSPAGPPAPRSPALMLRCNPPGTADFEADLAAIPLSRLALLNLPKLDTPQQLLQAVERIAAAEAAQGLAEPLPLLVNIESARALRRAAELAAAHPRVLGLQLGLADLFESTGIDRRDAAAVHAVQLSMRLAAAEAGVLALDSAFTDLADDEGLRREAEAARRLGYDGKSCIHPRQLAVVNAAFTPDAAELERARRLLQAADAAERRGHGALRFEGRMVDAPHVARARALLARHAGT